jgi:hypothetical protein
VIILTKSKNKYKIRYYLNDKSADTLKGLFRQSTKKKDFNFFKSRRLIRLTFIALSERSRFSEVDLDFFPNHIVRLEGGHRITIYCSGLEDMFLNIGRYIYNVNLSDKSIEIGFTYGRFKGYTFIRMSKKYKFM